jgi:complexin-1/2
MVSLLGGGLFGNPLAGALGGDKEEKDEKKSDVPQEEDPEIIEARREAEERRNEKYRKMEEERETMRQGIRDKYGIKKKVPIEPGQDPGLEGRLGRKKKTPEELAAEANAELEDANSRNSLFPKSMDDLTAKVQELPGKVATTVSDAAEKCSVQ